eukprot:3337937-Amphidinium_carterae.2
MASRIAKRPAASKAKGSMAAALPKRAERKAGTLRRPARPGISTCDLAQPFSAYIAATCVDAFHIPKAPTGVAVF